MTDKIVSLRLARHRYDRYVATADESALSSWAKKILDAECDRVEAEERRAEFERVERKRVVDAAHGHY